jgi:hypothetical protein
MNPNGPRGATDGPVVSLSLGTTPDGLHVVGLMIHHPLIDDALRPYVGLTPEECDSIALALIRAADMVRRGLAPTLDGEGLEGREMAEDEGEEDE